NAKLPDHSYRF
ncbi:hypothetical protein D018_0777B, partial [Vibrio parahaemolyticus VP2007-007]